MKPITFNKKPLALLISAVLTTGLSQVVMAQTTGEDVVKPAEVTAQAVVSQVEDVANETEVAVEAVETSAEEVTSDAEGAAKAAEATAEQVASDAEVAAQAIVNKVEEVANQTEVATEEAVIAAEQVATDMAATEEVSNIAEQAASPQATDAVESETAKQQQDNAVDSSTDNVVQIQGIRGSLTQSMNRKREASGVVDVITSEDIGKFPDTNLAESLQRITGVAISRVNGEGSQITVRGWGPQFNLVTLNGRQMPGTGYTRNYSFENLASDGVSALEIHKTTKADNPSGGLGSTVNIVTSKPFDAPGLRYSASVKGINDSSNVEGDDITPEVSAVFSNTFNDETFGVAFSYNHHRRDFQKQYANIQGWQAGIPELIDADGNVIRQDWGARLPSLDAQNGVDARAVDQNGDPVGMYTLNGELVPVHFFPRDMNYGISNYQRERTNGNLTLQFAPKDNWVVTLDYTATKATTAENSLGWGMWNEFGGNINAYELDANGTAIYLDTSGNDGSFTASRGTTEVDERSLGLNLAWQAADNLAFRLDYHDSKNKIDNGADPGLGSYGTLVLGSDQLMYKIYDFRTGEIPHAQIFWNNGSTILGAGEMDSHFSQFVHSPGQSSVEQLQIDGTWENFDTFDVPLLKLDFGVASTKQNFGGSNAWSGLIGGFLFNPSYTEIFPDGMFTLHDTSDFLDQFAGGGAALNPGYYYSFSFDEVVARSAAFLTNDVLGGQDYFATTAYHPMGTQSSSSLVETTKSLYLNSLWEFEWGQLPVQINTGFRYEQSKVPASALVNIPVAVWWRGGSEWHTQYSGFEVVDFTGEYDVFLPAFDFKIDFTEDLVGRFSLGKSITRADLGSLLPSKNYSASTRVNNRFGSEGNTALLPYESLNLDLSLEWYYGEGSYFAMGYYRKDVDNFIGTQIRPETVEGIREIFEGPRWLQAEADIIARGDQPTDDAIFAQMQANGAVLNAQGYIEPAADDPLMVWDLRRPFNDPDKKTVDGYEIAIQHMFGDSGFGVGANITLTNGDIGFNNMSMDEQRPLNGISDSYNFQGFYDKDGLSVRVVYAWRDEYLIGVGQSQGSSEAPPQYAKEFGQWDMNINYELADGFNIYFEGLNLNNETEQHFGRFKEQFLQANQYGARYVLGTRYSFK